MAGHLSTSHQLRYSSWYRSVKISDEKVSSSDQYYIIIYYIIGII